MGVAGKSPETRAGIGLTCTAEDRGKQLPGTWGREDTFLFWGGTLGPGIRVKIRLWEFFHRREKRNGVAWTHGQATNLKAFYKKKEGWQGRILTFTLHKSLCNAAGTRNS